MWQRLLRLRGGPDVDVEVGVAVPVGCLVPIALAIVVLLGVGCAIGTRTGTASTPSSVVVRVIDDGAASGPQVFGTQVVPLR
jgi:hypothetical protein